MSTSAQPLTLEQRLEAIEAAVAKIQAEPPGATDVVARKVLSNLLGGVGEVYNGAGDDKAKL